jgi:hypothetical protein
MPYGGPSVAPSTKSFLGIAREMQAGSALLPTNTIPMAQNTYSPEDTPRYLPDNAIRGSMAMRYENIIGPEDGQFSFGGPAFLDTYGFFLDNAFGDMSTTGSSPANGTSLSGSVSTLTPGAVQCTVNNASGYASASTVQIDSGNVSEVVILSAAPSGTLLSFANNPLRFAHSAGATVSTCSGPFVHQFAILNSLLGYGGVEGAQPPTHSLTDNYNLNYTGSPGTNSSNARTYPSACVSAFDMTLNSEQLLSVRVQGNSFLSAPATAVPTNTVSTAAPVAAWQAQVYIGGTAPSNLVTTIGELSVNVRRTLRPDWTLQGNSNPYIIARGNLDINGNVTFSTPGDESPLQLMLQNNQPLLQIVLDNGLSGTSHLRVLFRCSQASWVQSRPERTQPLVGFTGRWESVANFSDVGGSGGQGPGIFQLTNYIPTYALCSDDGLPSPHSWHLI